MWPSGRAMRAMTYRSKPTVPTSALLVAALVFCLPRPIAKAEDSIAYRFENYREEDGRITVETQSSSLDQDIGAYGHLSLTGTIDAVAGATPTGRPAPAGTDQVVMTEIHTRRKAWNGDYAQQFKNVNVDVGYAESRESDYVSYGWSLNTLTDFNQKNTTLRAGVAGTDDRVEVFFEPAYLPKHTHSAIVGVTQLLDPLTFVTLNVTVADATGYLSEPHKFVEKGIEIFTNIVLEEGFGENSPNRRNSGTVYAAINHAFPKLKGAFEGSYRFYSDSYGIVGHTFEAAWYEHVGSALILEPLVRYYQQSAARFYYYNLDNTSIIPVRVPMGTAPYYTSDFRLSAEDTYSFGLKATWRVVDRVQLVASYERYVMNGRDGVTPASAYPTAGVSSLGVRFTW
jgi:Protein of unknown function (DUF3570)